MQSLLILTAYYVIWHTSNKYYSNKIKQINKNYITNITNELSSFIFLVILFLYYTPVESFE